MGASQEIRLEQVSEDSQVYAQAAWQFMRDCKAADKGFTAGLGCLESFDNPEEVEEGWVKEAIREALGEDLPEGWVPAIQYYAINQRGQLVGMIQLRLDLTEPLLEHGGNIGYSVHPQFRRRGYAEYMLEECLTQARAHGLERVLLTCRETNEGSKHTILACGGSLENTVSVPEEGLVQRYWINL
ncbi:hypothetical protein KIMH_14840 [Bombiscardovia apis]|uniref:N-acetyltransferase domain-containing protein n=1 Tax=Bombiscardovia apis TaxID=2932182 RepID=A0ABN6SI21_9BIFI|nr:GNAT family N-acetyltransferase [Bombiscardovia apis]BDR55373.1 hypothetical protein KIMH_14840 [Bombiscardovia apis]